MSEAMSGIYRRRAGEPVICRQLPVICRQFFAVNVLTYPMVNGDETGGYYVIDGHTRPVMVVDGDWILPDSDSQHFTVIPASVFHELYEVLDDYRRIATVEGDPANPPASIAHDPDDLQAQLGQPAKS